MKHLMLLWVIHIPLFYMVKLVLKTSLDHRDIQYITLKRVTTEILGKRFTKFILHLAQTNLEFFEIFYSPFQRFGLLRIERFLKFI